MGGRFWTSIYLIFVAWPLSGLIGSDVDPVTAAATVACVLAFCGLYLRIVWTALPRPHRDHAPGLLVLLYALAAGPAVPLGQEWLFVAVFFLITALAVALPPRAMPVGVALTVGGLIAGIVLVGGSLADDWWIPVQAVLFAGALHGFLEARRSNAELRRARTRAERLAVDNERLRFARDMHDILGHSLSVMTLKSQLAGRLTTVDAERARAEMAEVEELSRQALAEVRHAVAGYRALHLPDEIDVARNALAAAGIGAEIAARPIPDDAASLLAWVVREGATNVVRHSRARRCRIRCGTENGLAYVEITDDGGGSDAETEGSGLRGLAERLQAADGFLRAHRMPGGGFRLLAGLPVAEESA